MNFLPTAIKSHSLAKECSTGAMSQPVPSVDFYSASIESLTLREALNIYYLVHPQFTPWYNAPSPILRKTLRSHDISHVLFGCPTTMLGELRVQFWNTFGCVVPKSLGDIWDSLKDSNTRALVLQPGIFKFFLTHVPQALQVRKSAKQMTKKWRFFEEEAYLDTTVGNIRREFNIKLIE